MSSMTATKHPQICFDVDIPEDGSKDRSIMEALFVAADFLNKHLTAAQKTNLGQHYKFLSGGMHVMIPRDILTRTSIRGQTDLVFNGEAHDTMMSEMMARFPDVKVIMSEVDSASVFSRNEAKPSETMSLDDAAKSYAMAAAAVDAMPRPSLDEHATTDTSKWHAAIDAAYKAKCNLIAAARRTGQG